LKALYYSYFERSTTADQDVGGRSFFSGRKTAVGTQKYIGLAGFEQGQTLG
jgi:hypothetical protein